MSFHQALEEFFAEGGQPGRGKRYANNGRVLSEGMQAIGFNPLLPRTCKRRSFTLSTCRQSRSSSSRTSMIQLKDRGYVIYPGKLTVADSFRIGCIGRIDESHMRGFLANVAEVLAGMGIASFKSAA